METCKNGNDRIFHNDVLNLYEASNGFCLDTVEAILVYREVAWQIYGISKFFKIPLLREIFCLFKLKSLLELIIN